MYLQMVKLTVLHCIPPPPGKPLSTTLCAFVCTLVAAAEGPSRVSGVFVHDGESFLLLALLFVDCCFSANLLRKKKKVLCCTNPYAENGLETQMKLPELLADHLALLHTLCRN
jgi:hypothetical protein